jgi:hypothetical protein
MAGDLFNFGFSDQSTSGQSTTSGTSTTQATQKETQAQTQQQTAAQKQQTQQQQQQTGQQTSQVATTSLDQDTINALKGVLSGQVSAIQPGALSGIATSQIDLSKLMTGQAAGVSGQVANLNDALAKSARAQFETSTLGDINAVASGVGSKDNSYYMGTLANARAALEGNIAGIQSQNTLQGIQLATQAGQAASGVAGQTASLVDAIQSGNPQAIQTVLNIAGVLKGSTTTQTMDTQTLQNLLGSTSSEAQSIQNMISALVGQKDLSSTTATTSSTKSEQDTSGFNFGLGI